jgi:hypothetical protein
MILILIPCVSYEGAVISNSVGVETSPLHSQRKGQPAEILKGWQQIAAFLGEPTSVVQRWASEGMPVRKQGRYVETTLDELNAWLGKESGKPVHVTTENTDLTAELKRGSVLCSSRDTLEKVTEGKVITRAGFETIPLSRRALVFSAWFQWWDGIIPIFRDEKDLSAILSVGQ